jgi:hypothetical protein
LPDLGATTIGQLEEGQKLLSQYNSVESLVDNTIFTPTKQGALHGVTQGDGNSIFKAITHGGKILPDGRVIVRGFNLGVHDSFKNGFTINMKEIGTGTLYKVRIKK